MKLLRDVLRTASRQHPKRTAVIQGSRSLTYAELHDQVANLAARLSDRGIGTGDRVGVLISKSIEAVAAIYATLEVGAAYVPLDAGSPEPRLQAISREGQLTCVIFGEEERVLAERIAKDAPSIRSAQLVELLPQSSGTSKGNGPPRPVTPEDLAYILFTSGSTGRPKGVAISNRAAVEFVKWGAHRFRVTAEDRLSSHAPFHFDLSIFDLFVAASVGACVVLISAEEAMFPVSTAALMREREISIWYSVPTAISRLITRGNLAEGDLPKLRLMLFAGEVFPPRLLRAALEALPTTTFVNLYGPTETNVCTEFEISSGAEGTPDPLPIGYPLPGVAIFILDDAGEPVPDGARGELCVASPFTMAGYFGGRASGESPFHEATAGRPRLYRTGDIAYRDSLGRLLLVGRRDNQVKHRGYRVELGEIEAAIRLHPAVAECAVVFVNRSSESLLAAYVELLRDTDERSLRRFCASRLPRYMLPDSISISEALPRNRNGKVDRQALERHSQDRLPE